MDELKAQLEHYLRNSIGQYDGSLSSEMGDAIQYYYGEPFNSTNRRTGPQEIDNRSQAIDRVVLETIETLKPLVIKQFAPTDPIVEFRPDGTPGDDERVKMENKQINALFWDLGGYQLIQDSLHDACLQKNCIAKVVSDEVIKVEIKYIDGQTEETLALLEQTGWEIIEADQDEDGLYSAYVRRKNTSSNPSIEIIRPEYMRVHGAQESINLDECLFCASLSMVSKSELIELGYDDLNNLKWTSYNDSSFAALSRRQYNREINADLKGPDESTWYTWIADASVMVDMDGDGIAERWRIVFGTDEAGGQVYEILDKTPQETCHYVSGALFPLPHKWAAFSVADLTMDLQDTASSILRGEIDNLVYLNNAEGLYDENRIDGETFAVSHPQKHHAVDGPPSDAYMPLPKHVLPPQVFELQKELEQRRKARTGVGEDVMAFDSEILRSVNTGVLQNAITMAMLRPALIATNYAQTFIKPIIQKLHKLLRENPSQRVIQIDGEYQRINPSMWAPRSAADIKVGIGVASKTERIASLDAIISKQGELVQGGFLGKLITLDDIHRSLSDWADAMGIDSKRYFPDPRMMPPLEDKPDPQMEAITLQAQAAMAEVQRRAQQDVFQAQLAREKQSQDAYIKTLAEETKRLQTQADAVQGEEKARMDQLAAEAKQRMEMIEAIGKQRQAEISALIAKYSAELKDDKEQAAQTAAILDQWMQSRDTITESGIDEAKQIVESTSIAATEARAAKDTAEATKSDLTAELTVMRDAMERQMEVVTAQSNALSGIMTELQSIIGEITDIKQAQNRPKQIQRDETGNIVAVDGKPVRRDAGGNVIGLG